MTINSVSELKEARVKLETILPLLKILKEKNLSNWWSWFHRLTFSKKL